jgi:tRNA-specific 2-thiouridylase
MKKKVLTAMSGGVDSSVAAALLLERGFDVRGVTMDLFAADANAAVADAKSVADALSIPHCVVDAADVFEQIVVNHFVNEYKSGRTPNPCVTCNRHLKFGLLMDKALQLGCDYLATGHYAKIDGGSLRRGADNRKDQSYFLYPILAAPTEKIMFPLGDLVKDEVKELAKRFNLPTAGKRESQDICFIPSGDYTEFLKSRGIGGGAAGHIVDTGGKTLGLHTGVHNFTTGQRKGLGALGKRMYVKRINVDDNTVVAAEEHELECGEIAIRDVVTGKKGLDVNKRYQVQIRYRSPPVNATVTMRGGDSAIIRFETPVRTASPGQSAVIYDGDDVVVGGIIV